MNFGEPQTFQGHPPWHPPQGGYDTGLKVYNSLVDAKVPFIPASGQAVKWYTCGPTVYDVCHMGHARAYLTFDILRRIMEDYFHYDILFQVNITDIDDKIIKRARCNKLLDDYSRDNAGEFEDVCRDVDDAVLKLRSKLVLKLDQLKAPLAATATSREVEENETLVKEQELKIGQADATMEAVKAAKETKQADKVIAAARDALGEWLDAALGSTVTDHKVFDAHARKYEQMYLEDMDALGVRRPDVMTRVSEYVPQVVNFVTAVEEKGMAYSANGSVYFHTQAFRAAGHDYPKLKVGLAAASEAEMAEGEGALSQAHSDEKKSGSDFALWKSSKAGEPAWESPWGPGRPGWHIECSVMASEVLGSHMDIHAGGEDLRFPHHDNELAQSEAMHGCQQWVNYFLHAGHLNIRGLKMSKSLKNFITIRQALEEHSARQMRLMFLLQPWDRAMYYSDQAMADAKTKEALFKNFFGAVKAALRDDNTGKEVPSDWRPQDISLQNVIAQCQSKVHSCLCDNFDTPGAVSALCEMVSEANKYLSSEAASDLRHLLLRKAAAYLTRMLRIFGLLEGTDEIGFPAKAAQGGEALLAPHLDCLVGFREEVRSAAREMKHSALLDLCDHLRDHGCVELGVRLEDRAEGGAIWKLDDPATLRREVEEKKAKAAEAAAKKRANKLEKLKKELAKWQAAAVAPDQYYKTRANEGKYIEFDEKNLPLKLADGTEVSKKQQKNNEKEMSKHVAAHNQLLENGGEDYLKSLTDEMAALELEG